MTPMRKDRTAADRSRRYRERRKQGESFTPTGERPATATVPSRLPSRWPIVSVVTLAAALGLACVSAGFSIVGLTSNGRGP